MAVKKTKEKREFWTRELDVTDSSAGKILIQDRTGVEYDSAVDPPEMGRTYKEGRVKG